MTIFAFGVLLYAYAFAQSYHIDDFIQLRWLDGKTLLEIWTANDRGYYRPLSFMLWKLVHLAWGSYQPAALHGLNVISHAANGVLIFALFMRALPEADSQARRWVSVLTALLFLAFPFSYQAVPWIGALNHPLATNFILLALWMAFSAHETRSAWRQLLALAFTALAIVAHEAGVIVGPLLLLLLAMQTPRPTLRDLLRRVWPFFALGVALPVAIALLRNAPITTNAVTLESRFQNSSYFLQGLVYPLAPLAVPLMKWLNISDIAATLLVCVPALLLLAGSLFALGKGRIALFAIGWYVIAIAPAALLLSFSYVIDGPRLMYQASIGAALLVAAQVLWLWQRGARIAKIVLGALLPAGAMLFSLVFLAQRADLYEQTRRLANGLVAEMGLSASNDKMAIVVNFPSWLAPKQNSYAIGHEGVTFVPGYSSLIDLVYLLAGKEKPVASVVLPHLQNEWRFNFANHGAVFDPYAIQPSLRLGDRILFVSTKGQDILITDAGNLEATDAQRNAAIATFSDTLQLLSQTNEQLDAQHLRVTLRWQVLQPPAEELRTFVHLFSADGNLIAQEDGWPLMNMADPRAWQAGDVWRDVRIITLPANLPAGRYTIHVGVYRAADGARLPAVDGKGHPIADSSASAGEWIAR
jgi:hypothetical protein